MKSDTVEKHIRSQSKRNRSELNGKQQTKQNLANESRATVTIRKSKAICIKSMKNSLDVGDLCFAKVQGFHELPAFMLNVENTAI